MRRSFVVASCLLLAGCGGLGQATVAESDISLMEQTLQLALEIDTDGRGRAWVNPETGHRGTITPVATYLSEPGVFCRDYEDTQVIGDRQTIYESRACRVSTGRWIWIDDVAPPRRS